MARKTTPESTICRNRKAAYRFHILEKIDCGIVLEGTEVKSLRSRAASIEEAYACIVDNELWLIGCHIAPYAFGHTKKHDPLRRRKLLVHASQIRKLRTKVEQKGVTLVPLSLYFNERGLAKVSLGLAHGKNLADKRRTLQDRDHRREIDRALRRKR
jgi:SsrA-binding protein